MRTTHPSLHHAVRVAFESMQDTDSYDSLNAKTFYDDLDGVTCSADGTPSYEFREYLNDTRTLKLVKQAAKDGRIERIRRYAEPFLSRVTWRRKGAFHTHYAEVVIFPYGALKALVEGTSSELYGAYGVPSHHPGDLEYELWFGRCRDSCLTEKNLMAKLMEAYEPYQEKS